VTDRNKPDKTGRFRVTPIALPPGALSYPQISFDNSGKPGAELTKLEGKSGEGGKSVQRAKRTRSLLRWLPVLGL
jgi:hypothetical protein